MAEEHKQAPVPEALLGVKVATAATWLAAARCGPGGGGPGGLGLVRADGRAVSAKFPQEKVCKVLRGEMDFIDYSGRTFCRSSCEERGKGCRAG